MPMLYSPLGRTGLKVSALCLGALGFGVPQGGLRLSQGRDLVKKAYDRGVNFFDAAEFYHVYPYLKEIANLPDVVIASRCYAYDESGMKRSLDMYRRELDRDVVDMFGLHEQESGLTLKGHEKALRVLERAKERGTVKAISVSTHYVACVRAAAVRDDIDVIFAILNAAGLGIVDGTRKDMEDALCFAHQMGKGIYIMKALGGGHLHAKAMEALEYVRNFPYKDSVCVGIKSLAELQFAIGCLTGQEVDPDLLKETRSQERRLIVQEWCQGCGLCVQRCGFGALVLEQGRAWPDMSKCVLCGYCARVCPHFCIKVV
ncbi:MAG: aldo/keto reductase [Bacillota bacterium]|jgi:aryl-alcohol dehydrogenase-like predicted oxidoreductase